jgi:hypothetical protein
MADESMRKDFIRKMVRKPTPGLALVHSQIKLSKSVEKVRGYYRRVTRNVVSWGFGDRLCLKERNAAMDKYRVALTVKERFELG